MNIGDRFKSIQCGWFEIVGIVPHKKGKRFIVEFDEVMGIKYKTVREKKHVISGSILNPYYPLKLGLACVGNVNSKKYNKEFNKWRSMIERCYDINNRRYDIYGARGVRVCDRWLCFEYFLDDLIHVKGYDVEKLQNGKLHLDKDIIGNGLLYSPETCILVSPSENIKDMNLRNKQKLFKATNLENNNIITSNNQTEFAKLINVSQSEISRCLNGERKSVRGYKIELI